MRSSTISPIMLVSIIAKATADTKATVTALVPALRSLTSYMMGKGVLRTLKEIGCFLKRVACLIIASYMN
jgi:hypothetical protein